MHLILNNKISHGLRLLRREIRLRLRLPIKIHGVNIYGHQIKSKVIRDQYVRGTYEKRINGLSRHEL